MNLINLLMLDIKRSVNVDDCDPVFYYFDVMVIMDVVYMVNDLVETENFS